MRFEDFINLRVGDLNEPKLSEATNEAKEALESEVYQGPPVDVIKKGISLDDYM